MMQEDGSDHTHLGVLKGSGKDHGNAHQHEGRHGHARTIMSMQMIALHACHRRTLMVRAACRRYHSGSRSAAARSLSRSRRYMPQ